jgi:hypothetical protein
MVNSYGTQILIKITTSQMIKQDVMKLYIRMAVHL